MDTPTRCACRASARIATRTFSAGSMLEPIPMKARVMACSVPARDLYRHAPGKAERIGLFHAHLDLAHALLGETEFRNGIGQRLLQKELRVFRHRENALLECPVIDGVLDAVAFAGFAQDSVDGRVDHA